MLQLQNPPPHLIDWAFIAALITTAVTIGTKWLLPALQKIAQGKSDASDLAIEGGVRDLREAVGSIAETQATLAELLRGRTRMFEQQEQVLEKLSTIVGEIELRSRGAAEAIKAIPDIARELSEHRRVMEEPPKPKRGRGK